MFNKTVIFLDKPLQVIVTRG